METEKPIKKKKLLKQIEHLKFVIEDYKTKEKLSNKEYYDSELKKVNDILSKLGRVDMNFTSDTQTFLNGSEFPTKRIEFALEVYPKYI